MAASSSTRYSSEGASCGHNSLSEDSGVSSTNQSKKHRREKRYQFHFNLMKTARSSPFGSTKQTKDTVKGSLKICTKSDLEGKYLRFNKSFLQKYGLSFFFTRQNGLLKIKAMLEGRQNKLSSFDFKISDSRRRRIYKSKANPFSLALAIRSKKIYNQKMVGYKIKLNHDDG